MRMIKYSFNKGIEYGIGDLIILMPKGKHDSRVNRNTDNKTASSLKLNGHMMSKYIQ